MKLADWLKSNGKTDAWLAGQIGRDRSLVSRIRSGKVEPSLSVAVAISAATDGQVPPASLARAPTPEEGRAA